MLKYVGVQSWKDAHLQTLEIRVEQEENRVMLLFWVLRQLMGQKSENRGCSSAFILVLLFWVLKQLMGQK